MKLVYSEQAVADLVRLRTFIEEKNPGAARRVAHELINRIENLLLFPEIGRPVTLAPDPASLRDLIAEDYIVRYSVHSRTIVILRIWHHYEDRKEPL